MEKEGDRVNGFEPSPGRRGSDWGPIALLDKTKEFFRTCDVEGKGFITRTDMRVRAGECGFCSLRCNNTFYSQFDKYHDLVCTIHIELWFNMYRNTFI